MTPFTQALAADPTPSPSRQAPHECRPVVPEERLRKQEADRLFEARLQWFLALSAAA